MLDGVQRLVASTGDAVDIPIASLAHASPIWRRRGGSDAHTAHTAHTTNFPPLALQTFRDLCSIGAPCHARQDAPTHLALLASLAPIYAYGCTGMLHHVTHAVATSTFCGWQDEVHLQNILVTLDAHDTPLPPGIMHRLVKTVANASSSSPHVPFNWKISIAPDVPGFKLYKLSLRLLTTLARRAPTDDAVYQSIAHMALRWKLAVKTQRLWRKKCQKMGDCG